METTSCSPLKEPSSHFSRRKANVFVALQTLLSVYFVGAVITFMVCTRSFLLFHIFSPTSQASVALFRVNTTFLPGKESLAILVPEKEALEVLEEVQAPAHTLRDERGVAIFSADMNTRSLNKTEENLNLVIAQGTFDGDQEATNEGEVQNLDDLEPEFMRMPALRKNKEQTVNLQSMMKRMSNWERRQWLRENWSSFQILRVDSLSHQFQDRIRRFFCNNQRQGTVSAAATENVHISFPDSLLTSEILQRRSKDESDEKKICKTNGSYVVQGSPTFCTQRFFLTWMSPVSSFSARERIGLESIFKWHPRACVAIISRTMDSEIGRKILEPFVARGYRIMAVTPDLLSLFVNLPAAKWLQDLRDGSGDPGCINFMQNMSNIMRLAALYKFGGIYLDTDVIVLKSFDGLRNVVGTQSEDSVTGLWTRLNNAVLVFDREHPLVYEFLHEFVVTFDGNVWGWNGPYLVSRVVRKVTTDQHWQNCSSASVLPLQAFYPVNWIDIVKFFQSPSDDVEYSWQATELEEMEQGSYTIHLWNKKTNHLRVEKGSIVEALFKKSCLFCKSHYPSKHSTSLSSRLRNAIL